MLNASGRSPWKRWRPTGNAGFIWSCLNPLASSRDNREPNDTSIALSDGRQFSLSHRMGKGWGEGNPVSSKRLRPP